MSERTTSATVIFQKTANINGLNEPLPAGKYIVETDEEQIHGLSFIAYRRLRTSIIVQTRIGASKARQLIEIDPESLATALALDSADHTNPAASCS